MKRMVIYVALTILVVSEGGMTNGQTDCGAWVAKPIPTPLQAFDVSRYRNTRTFKATVERSDPTSCRQQVLLWNL